MKTKSLRMSFLLIIALALFAGGYAVGQSRYAPINLSLAARVMSQDATDAFRPFWETWGLLHDEYFDQPLDDIQLAEGAIDGMLATLDDPNTRYLPPEQEAAARRAMEGNLEGIGAEVTTIDGAITIVAPYEGSPAENAGLLPGDILREVDGTPLTGLHPAEAAALVRGPSGTAVRLLIERDGEFLELEVIRDIIRIPSVRGELLEDNIAYIRLSRFANDSSRELADTLSNLIEEELTGIIVDVRGNPGGSLTTAVDIADHFLNQGTLLIESFGNGEEIVFESAEDGKAQDLPLVVLIDRGSASASEVLAGAVRDRERGVLIGETTFGKGTVQVWRQLSNEGGIRITTARWLTPDGTWVHEAGLEPDFYVLLPEGEQENSSDTQLEAAIDFLRGRPVLETKPLEDS